VARIKKTRTASAKRHSPHLGCIKLSRVSGPYPLYYRLVRYYQLIATL